jgi:FKBP-type peptidyl-prolyl cis-trans isomerase FklB
MKAWSSFCLIVLMAVAAAHGQEPVKPAETPPAAGAPAAAGSSEFKDLKSKVSYIIGQRIGQSMKQDGIDLDVELVMRGFREAAAGKPSAIGEEEMAAAMQAFQMEQQAKAQEAMKALADKNTKEGAAFLAENAKKEGVKTLASGVQYKVLKAGTGTVKPKETDTVSAHYSGRLIDGTKFDSSYDRGQPLSIPVNQVIPGWTEVLQLMVPGDKWEVYIPGDKAYGPRGSPPVIGPNSVLIFEMELVGIEGAK